MQGNGLGRALVGHETRWYYVIQHRDNGSIVFAYERRCHGMTKRSKQITIDDSRYQVGTGVGTSLWEDNTP